MTILGRRNPPVLLAAWTFLLSLPLLLAQTTNPQNGTVPVDPSGSQLVINSRYDVDPLTDQAGLSASPQSLRQINLVGNLVSINAVNIETLQVGQFAYISCDPLEYQGFQNASQTVSKAIPMIQGTNGTQGAIVLYTTTSIFCTYAPGAAIYPWVYTMTNATDAKTLEGSLNATGLPSIITLNLSFVPNTTSTTPTQAPDALGPSPTTAVAMIILYSITGIITTLFLVIIITGAVRAHRHPERYGPRNIMGRPRQTRARGIARAMLESLPIVKFGEPERTAPKTLHHEGDVELGQSEGRRTTTSTSSEVTRSPTTAREHQPGGSSPVEDGVTTEEVGGIAPPMEREEGGGENNAENGLACSVCTDDFIKGQDIRVLPCNHKFHPDCIDPWLLNVSGTCPMCRVDLRPVGDHTEGIEDGPVSSPNAYLPRLPGSDPGTHPRSTADPAGNTSEPNTSNRRRSNGLSLYIHHTLNFRRMRDATPEERIDALRRIRLVNRATDGDPERGGRRRSRVGSRFSRIWGSQQASSSEDIGPDLGVAEPEEHSQR